MASVTVKALITQISPTTSISVPEIHLKAKNILGILGPNGSGKTTLLKTIGGLITPSKGTCQVIGSIGWKGTQLPPYCPFLASDVLSLHPSKTPPPDIPFDPLVQFCLTDIINRPMSTLSTGEQHRCLLARLFYRHYDILILDEPLTGLDPFQQFQLGQALSIYAETGGIVILASHNPDWVKSICTHTGVMTQLRYQPIILKDLNESAVLNLYAPPTDER